MPGSLAIHRNGLYTFVILYSPLLPLSLYLHKSQLLFEALSVPVHLLPGTVPCLPFCFWCYKPALQKQPVLQTYHPLHRPVHRSQCPSNISLLLPDPDRDSQLPSLPLFSVPAHGSDIHYRYFRSQRSRLPACSSQEVPQPLRW